MVDHYLDDLQNKSKDELIAIIHNFSEPHDKSNDARIINEVLSEIQLPAILLAADTLNIISKNKALDSKINIYTQLLSDFQKEVKKAKKMPDTFQWKYCQFDNVEKKYTTYVQEISLNGKKYILLTILNIKENWKDDFFSNPENLPINNVLKVHNIGLWYYDLIKKEVYLNETLQLRLELPYSNDAFKRENLRNYIVKDDLEKYDKLKELVYNMKEVIEFEGRMISTVEKKVTKNLFKILPVIKNGKVCAIWGTVTLLDKTANEVSKPEINRSFTRQMGQSLRRKNKILSALEKNVKIAWWYWNQNSNIIDYSENWEEVIEVKKEVFFFRKDFLNLVHPDDQDKVSEVIQKLLVDDVYVDCSYRLTLPDQPTKFLYSVNIRLGNDLYGIIHDITDLKNSEFNVLNVEKTYKEVIDSLDEMIIRFKPDTTLTFVNKAYANFFGKSQEELIGTKFLPIMPENLQADAITKFEEIKRDKKTLINNYKVFDDGEKNIWHRITDYPILDDEGNLVEIQSISIDITEKINAKLSLIQSEQKYRMLSENSSDIIFWLDKDLKLSYVNPAVRDVLGYSEKELMSLPVERIIPAKMLKQAQIIYQISTNQNNQKINHHKISNWKTQLTKKDGHSIWGEISTSPLTDDKGNFTGLIGIVRDISESKQYEDKLIEANKELANLIEEKNKFISMMSHDFKTPLNSLMGMVFLLKNELSPIPQSEILETLNFSANHLKTIVNNILDLSILQQKKIYLDKKTFELSRLLKNCLDTFQVQARDKNIELRHEFLSTKDIKLVGDHDRLFQIINNLLSNAIKFTDKGFVNFFVLLSPAHNYHYALKVVIEDSGCGIEESQLPRIYEPFVRFHESNKEGNGCGLTIVKELVELFQGSVQVESRVGSGTKFTLDLILPSAKALSTEYAESELSVMNGNLKGINVLYVEDLEFNQKMISAYAKLWNFNLEIVGNAEEAIELIYERKFDVILMDIFLPGINGDVATKMIRKAEEQQKIKSENIIFAVTALEEVTHPDWFGDKGFNDVVPKPIDPSLLYQKMNSWINKNKAAVPSAAIENNGGNTLFVNLKKTFKSEPDSLKTLLKSFHSDLQVQLKLLTDAINANDNTAYRNARHNLSAMLAILNENKLLTYLNKYKSIPDAPSTKGKVRAMIKKQITKLQDLIAKEINE